jgi:hypothetical protein
LRWVLEEPGGQLYGGRRAIVFQESKHAAGVRGETSNTYYDWLLDRAYLLVPAQAYVGNFLKTFQEYPPRQKAASFTLDQVMEKILQPQHN